MSATPTPQPEPAKSRGPEEFDSPRWTLPPAAPVLIALVAIGSLLAIYTWRASKPMSSGRITRVVVAEQQDQHSVLVAIHVSLDNLGEKTMSIKKSSAKLAAAGQEFMDEAAASSDIPRYVAAFPKLGEGAIEPLHNETNVPPGGHLEGEIVVGFPVSRADFDQRTALSVTVEPYDQGALVINEKIEKK
jgi:hypothetical protein